MKAPTKTEYLKALSIVERYHKYLNLNIKKVEDLDRSRFKGLALLDLDLSVRALNVCCSHIQTYRINNPNTLIVSTPDARTSFYDFVKLFNYGRFYSIHNCGRKTIAEMQDLFNRFKLGDIKDF